MAKPGLIEQLSVGIGLTEPAPIGELSTAFKQGFLLTMEEDNKTTASFVFVVNPRSYVLSEPFQSVLTPAEDGTVVPEESGIITREITLEGTFGVSKKTVGKGFSNSQGGGPMGGNTHFWHLREFFRTYSEKKRGPTGHLVGMTFYCLRDGAHYRVVPRSFETPREARSTRMHYDYRISLTAIGEGKPFKLPKPEGHFNPLKDLNQAVNEARAAFAEGTKRLGELKAKVANIQVVMNNTAQLINAVSNFSSAEKEAITYPRDLAISGAEAVDRAGKQFSNGTPSPTQPWYSGYTALARMEAAQNKLVQHSPFYNDPGARMEKVFRGEGALTDDDIANGTGGADIGSRVRSRLGSDGSIGGIQIDVKNGFQGVIVQRTDTVESIASTYATTPETIVLINDLRPPYISSGGGPGIVKPGDTILVPASGLGGDGQSVSSDYLTSDDALYGVDMGIESDLYKTNGLIDIAVNVAGGSTDCELSRGIDNVTQGTKITISTEKGTTVFLPEIGISRMAGSKGTVETAVLATVALRNAILSDPRIEGIDSTRVVLDKDVLYQEVTPIVVGQRIGTTLTLPFGKASGDGA